MNETNKENKEITICETGNHVFIEKDGKVFCQTCGKTLRLSS